ncbi:MAG TPA: hypothetical protein VMD97_04025 [Candidatus Aquilonibacter sp.]|nr:hypothetical protein [Candidatus Aquilonibacter sp.]
MRALRRSPLFRIALLSLAVLFAHTAHAANRPILLVAPPCAGKVAAAQPDPEKRPVLGRKQVVRPRFPATSHAASGSALFFPLARTAYVLCAEGAAQISLARSALYVAQQQRPFHPRI